MLPAAPTEGNRGPSLLVAEWLTLAFALIVVGLRLHGRCISLNIPGWDDYTILAATVCVNENEMRKTLLMWGIGLRSCTGRHQHHSSGQSVWTACSNFGSSSNLSSDNVDDHLCYAPDLWNPARSTFFLSACSQNATNWTAETVARESDLHAHGVLRPHLDRLFFPPVFSVHTD